MSDSQFSSGSKGAERREYLDDGPPPGWNDAEAMKQPIGGKGLVTLKANADLEGALSEGRWLVMFGSQSCLMCHRTLPALERFARAVVEAEEGLEGVKVGVIDCEDPESMRGCFGWGASRFPALYLVQDGATEVIPYPMNRMRTVSKLLDFVTEDWEKMSKASSYWGPTGPMKKFRLSTFDTIDRAWKTYSTQRTESGEWVAIGRAGLQVAFPAGSALVIMIAFFVIVRKLLIAMARKIGGSKDKSD